MKQNLILLYFFIISLKGFCQINLEEYQVLRTSIPEESTMLVTNSNFFLAGEYLYYKTILLEKEHFSNISKMVYVELIGQNSEVVFKHKLKVTNSSANGDFFIPASLNSGHYKLISYTQWTQNNKKNNFSEKDLFIINPFSATSEGHRDIVNNNITEISKNDSVSYVEKSTASFASLELNQLIFGNREKVSININLDETVNSISTLSVRKVDSISIINSPEIIEKQNNRVKYYLPELRGEMIYGYLESNNGEPIDNIDVSLSFPGKNSILKNAVTNNKGLFYCIIDGNYDDKSSIIQVLGAKKDLYNITLETKKFNFYNQLEFNDLKIKSDLKDWLEQESVNLQIENAYFAIKADSIISSPSNIDFYNSIETTYLLDDYTRFKTIKETFVEVVKTASLSKQDSTFVFKVPDLMNIDYNRDLNYLAPLVLVDGFIIQNNHDIVNYNAAKIKSISTVAGQYIYGNSLYNGIISFKTYDGDFNITGRNYTIKVDYPSVLPSKKYYYPKYNSNQKLTRIPDYRKQLLWIPNLNTKGNTTIDFFTSDNKGLYQILLKLVMSNGETQTVSKYFTVN